MKKLEFTSPPLNDECREILLCCNSNGKVDAISKFVPKGNTSKKKPFIEQHWEGYLFGAFIEKYYDSLNQSDKKKFENALKRVVRQKHTQYSLNDVLDAPRDADGYPEGKPQKIIEAVSEGLGVNAPEFFLDFLKFCQHYAISYYYKAKHSDPEDAKKRAETLAIEQLQGFIEKIKKDLKPKNPYKGLSHFELKDADDFYGRSTEINELSQIIKKQRFTAVIGSSGCGKSSLIHAGVARKLEDEAGFAHIYCRFIDTDSTNPFSMFSRVIARHDSTVNALTEQEIAESLSSGKLSLATCLDRIRDEKPILVIIDQFEELFSFPVDDQKHFLSFLLKTLKESRSDATFSIVITLRNDFQSRLDINKDFAGLVNEKSAMVSHIIDEEALAAIISKPIENLSVSFEEGLAEAILKDTIAADKNLPLIEFALSRLWENQVERVMSFSVYEKMGRITGSIMNHAEKLIEGLDKEDQERAKTIFTSLVRPGSNGSPDTKKRISRDDFTNPDAWRFAQDLANSSYRLLITNEINNDITIELVHDRLIAEWPRLKNWLDEDRIFRLWQDRLQITVDDWLKNPESSDNCLRGDNLKEAEQYSYRKELSPNQKQFIEFSRKEERKRSLVYKSAAVALSVAFISSVILSVFLILSAQDLKKQKTVAISERDRAILNENRFVANEMKRFLDQGENRIAANLALHLLSKNPEELDETDFRRQSLTTLVRLADRYIQVKTEPIPDSVNALSLSPDAQYIAIGNIEGEVSIRNIKTWELINQPLSLTNKVLALQYNDDGSLLEIKTDQSIISYDVRQNKIVSRMENSEKGDAQKISDDFMLPKEVVEHSGKNLESISPINSESNNIYMNENSEKITTEIFLASMNIWDMAGIKSLHTKRLGNLHSLENLIHERFINSYMPYSIKNSALSFVDDRWNLHFFKKIKFLQDTCSDVESLEHIGKFAINQGLSRKAVYTYDFDMAKLFDINIVQNKIDVFSINNNEQIASWNFDSSYGNVTDMTFSSVGDNLIIAFDQGKVVKWNINSGERKDVLSINGYFNKVYYSKDEQYILAVGKTVMHGHYEYYELNLNSGKSEKLVDVSVSDRDVYSDMAIKYPDYSSKNNITYFPENNDASDNFYSRIIRGNTRNISAQSTYTLSASQKEYSVALKKMERCMPIFHLIKISNILNLVLMINFYWFEASL